VSEQKKGKKCSRYTSHYGNKSWTPAPGSWLSGAAAENACGVQAGAAAMVIVASNAQFKNASCEREAASMKSDDFRR
jgi:hypothetical protein